MPIRSFDPNSNRNQHETRKTFQRQKLQLPQMFFDSTRAPLATDDVTGGWHVGSKWTFSNVIYECSNNGFVAGVYTSNSAVWQKMVTTDLTGGSTSVDGTSIKFDGALQLTRMALTGDVTASEGAAATTIANDAVTNSKLANMSASTIKGQIVGGSGDPVDMTATQGRAVLDVSGILENRSFC